MDAQKIYEELVAMAVRLQTLSDEVQAVALHDSENIARHFWGGKVVQLMDCARAAVIQAEIGIKVQYLIGIPAKASEEEQP